MFLLPSPISFRRFPILFVKPASSLIGPSAPIIIPRAAQPIEEHIPDYEVELTVVIGKPAKNVSEANALDYVLGYTAGNDVSQTLSGVVLSDLFEGILPQASDGGITVVLF